MCRFPQEREEGYADMQGRKRLGIIGVRLPWNGAPVGQAYPFVVSCSLMLGPCALMFSRVQDERRDVRFGTCSNSSAFRCGSQFVGAGLGRFICKPQSERKNVGSLGVLHGIPWCSMRFPA